MKPQRREIKPVWFSLAKESTYSTRISLLPPSTMEITPFVCYAVCLGKAAHTPGLHVLENSAWLIRNGIET